LNELKPNPFKKYINGGVLNPQKIELLKESIKQDGFWDNVICRKNGNGYEIAYGHHRLEAAKQVLGLNQEIDIPVKELSDEMMIRIMGNENCMQNEEYAIYQVDQVLLAKKWLEDFRTDGVGKSTGGRPKEPASAETISKFLGEKNWSASKVKEYLRIGNPKILHPEILHKMKNAANKGGGEKIGEFTVSHAIRLSRLPLEKQLQVARMVEEQELNTRETEVVVSELLGGKVGNRSKRRVDRSRIEEVVKNLEGQEIVLTCKSLVDLVKRNPLHKFNDKEKALLITMENNLINELKKHIGKGGETICVK